MIWKKTKPKQTTSPTSLEARPSFFVREREVGLLVRISDPDGIDPDPSSGKKADPDLIVKYNQIRTRPSRKKGIRIPFSNNNPDLDPDSTQQVIIFPQIGINLRPKYPNLGGSGSKTLLSVHRGPEYSFDNLSNFLYFEYDKRNNHTARGHKQDLVNILDEKRCPKKHLQFDRNSARKKN